MVHGIEYRRWENVCSIESAIIIIITAIASIVLIIMITIFTITNIITIRVADPMNIPVFKSEQNARNTTQAEHTPEQNEPKHLHTAVNKVRGKK